MKIGLLADSVLTYRFAMEFSGMIACLDDLFVQPNYRNKGLATAALVELRSICRNGANERDNC